MKHQTTTPAVATAAFILLGIAAPAPALDIAGSLLIDLDAADYSTANTQWPQHSVTGIPGNFLRTGIPTKQTVAGVPAVFIDGGNENFVGPLSTTELHAAGATHSVEMWVCQGNARAEESVLSWSRRGGPAGTFAGFRYGTNAAFGAVARWAQPDMGFATLPALGQWHHIVVTYDGAATKTQKVYVDGALQVSEVVTDPASGLLDAYDDFSVNLGNERENNTGFTFNAGAVIPFSGAVSRIRVHSGVLDATQVANNYNAELAAHGGGLTAQQIPFPPLHRFSFNNPAAAAPDGTQVSDSIGGLVGKIRGGTAYGAAADASFTGTGVSLPGGASASAAYIDLPNRILSPHEAVTIEVWVTQATTQNWSRIVDIGGNTAGEVSAPGGAFTGNNFIMLAGNTGTTLNQRLERAGGAINNGNTFRDTLASTVLGTEFHHVVAYDPALKEWRWFRNGILMEIVPDNAGPTTLNDVNTWLGRSNYANDANFNGTFNEFRVYNYTLTESQAYGNYLAGPDTLNLASPSGSLSWTPTAAGTYNYNNAGSEDNWGTGAGGSFPNGVDAVAAISSALTGDQTVNLNTAVTLGNLHLGANNGGGFFALAPGSGGSLAMQSSGTATLLQAAASLGDEISAPLAFNSSTTLANASGFPLVLSGPLGGAATVTKSGSGDVILTADSLGFGGSIRVIAGNLLLGDNGTSGLVAAPFQTVLPGRLVINRSDNLAVNPVVSGTGSVEHRGSGTLTLTSGTSLTHTYDCDAVDGAGPLVLTGTATVNGPRNFRLDNNGNILGGDSVANINGWFSAGIVNGGEITIRDNASLSARDFNVGDVGVGQSLCKVEGGNVSFWTLFVGKNAGTSGVMIQTGGTVSRGTGGGDSRIGGAGTGTQDVWGAYRLLGGTLTTNLNFQIGAYGVGIMEIDGGNFTTTAGWPVIGRFQYTDAGNNTFESYGLMDVRSGGFTQGSAANRLIVGESGFGTLNVRDAGSVTLVGGLAIGGGASATEFGSGTVNLLGGTLTTPFVTQFNDANASGRLNLNGGTLKAGADSADFIALVDEVHVRAGGAVFDTNGYNVVVNHALSAPAGEGVATIPVLAGGSDYAAPPFVEITGGGGDGATAIATVAGGTVTGITITNPGNNYTSPPTVIIRGGGNGFGLTLDTPTLAANVSGGLAKNGAGTLTLGGVNTYTGPTAVNAGTLLVNGDQGAATGTTNVAAGATLGGTGILGGPVSVAGTLAPGSGIGTLATGPLSLLDGSTLAIEINTDTAAADKITVSGSGTTGNVVNLVLTDLGSNTALAAGTKLVLVDYSGVWDDTDIVHFNGSPVPNGSAVAFGANTFTVDYSDDTLGGTAVTLTAGAVTSPYQSWIAGFGLPAGDQDPLDDPDFDGYANVVEFALDGNPANPGNQGKMKVASVDTEADADTLGELTLTLAVRAGAVANDPASGPVTLTVDGIAYTIEGSADLTGFPADVSEVSPALPLVPAPSAGWQARSFRLDASNGLPNKGFLRVKVTAP